MECFSSSDEGFAAESLFDAYRAGAAAVVAETVKGTQTFQHLENQASEIPGGEAEGPLLWLRADTMLLPLAAPPPPPTDCAAGAEAAPGGRGGDGKGAGRRRRRSGHGRQQRGGSDLTHLTRAG